MAFCGKCGAQLHEAATFCANCGASTGVSDQTSTGGTPVTTHPAVIGGAPEQRGFWGSLFDLSFTSFVTMRLIKILFVLAIIGAALGAIGFVVSSSYNPMFPSWLAVVLAPIVFFFAILIARVYMEIIMVTFRMVEYLREIAEQGRGRG